MLRDATSKSKAGKVNKKTRRQVRFPGLVSDAERLGVHRNHLYLVLSGRRSSAALLSRYHTLKGTKN